MLTGLNANETVLTPSNVNSAQFGKLLSMPVDGKIYAQPLYVSGLSIPGQGTRNVVFVATQHDSVYAFDSDSGGLLWHDSFINPSAGVTSVPADDLTPGMVFPHGVAGLIGPEVGINSTPVIDPSTNTLYVVAYTKEVSGATTSYVYRLHALDVTTGAEKFGGPVAIHGSVNGTGQGNDGNGHVLFDARQHDQRTGLLLLNGVVYFGFASWEDIQPYHGWFLGYDAHTLQQVAVFNDTPNGGLGGIWSGNTGISTDGTYIYIATGNGSFDTTLNASGFPVNGNYGDSFVKLAIDPTTNPSHQNINGWGLKVVDYFTPYNQQTLQDQDLDLGSGALTLLPDQPGDHPHELVGAGKQGTLYVVDRDNMGHFDPSTNHVVQELDSAIGGLFGTAGYFDGQLFYGGVGDYLKAFQVTNGLLSTSPTSQSGNVFSYPGTLPTISANGTSDGIVWAKETYPHSSNRNSSGVLHAYDAANLSNELYSSAQVPSRDQEGFAVNFASPTVADGKVYVGTASELDVYGLFPMIADAGFEEPVVGAGQFQYRPTGSSWTFSGAAGISGNNSGFTSGNTPAPEGSQVAFLQKTGSFSQSVTASATSSYVLTFDAAQRGNVASHQDFSVLVDGVTVGTFTPTDTSYQSLTTAAFTLSPGSHTVTFQGLNSAGGDNTAFVDQVTFTLVRTSSLIADAGFEQVQVGAGQFQYRPAGSPWTFSGSAGISANNSGFTSGNPPAPAGLQVAFLQKIGSFSQTVTNWAAGSYVLTFDAAQRGNLASRQDVSVLVDGAVVGTFTPSGTLYQSYTTGAFTVTTGSHTITFRSLNSAGGDNTAFVDQVDFTLVSAAPSIADAGFEQVQMGAGQFQYRPSGSPWTFSNRAGISGNNSGFTSGNPPAPEGSQVAFLQMMGSFSQTVTAPVTGSYVLTFDAAQRGNWQTSRQDFSVLVDGVAVGNFTPTDTSYRSLTTAAFTLTPGSHTIIFQGLDSAGGDNTVFVDQVAFTQVSTTPWVGDAVFEQVRVGAGQFQYRPSGSPWTFSGSAGIAANNSGFTSGNPPAPEGSQVAFLQKIGSFSQTVTNPAAGSYVVTFNAAQRGNWQASRQDFNVLVDGVAVDTFTPSGTSYQRYTTAVFTLSPGSHTITFQGLDSAGGDNTALVDQVAFTTVSAVPSIADAGFEQVQVGAGQFQYRPSGSPWTFSGSAGIAANNSGFTSGNSPAPEGSQVAFLQKIGSFSQTVTNWAAGSYVLTFDAAQRGNIASRQDFNVLVDGAVVGTFTPTDTSYQSYSTAAFTVTAGSHTITFHSLNSAGGDNTAFVDQVTLT
jgi:hypothetical protein